MRETKAHPFSHCRLLPHPLSSTGVRSTPLVKRVLLRVAKAEKLIISHKKGSDPGGGGGTRGANLLALRSRRERK